MRRWITAVALVVAGCGDVGDPNRDAQVINIDSPVNGGDGGGTTDGYSAFALIGGIDRVVLVKTRPLEDVCFGITLQNTGSMPSMGLVLPIGWRLEIAQALRPSAACNPGYTGPVTDGVPAKSQLGSIEWSGSGFPSSVSKLDVMLFFDMPPPLFPPEERLAAMNLPVM